MKKLILLLIHTFPALATGSLIIHNHDFESGPLIAVLSNLGQADKCHLILPSGRSDLYFAASRSHPNSFDTFYQRINGWLKLYKQTDFDPDPRQALRLCNRTRAYLNKKPLYEKRIYFASQYRDPNIIVTWPDDAMKKEKK